MILYRIGIFLLLSLMPAFLAADRGAIPFDPDVRIFEPNQRAIIAWNGQKQILLLSTDMRASRQVEILEVLPLPSEPQVKKGDFIPCLRSIRQILFDWIIYS